MKRCPSTVAILYRRATSVALMLTLMAGYSTPLWGREQAPSQVDLRIAKCDALASSPRDERRPAGLRGVQDVLQPEPAIAACELACGKWDRAGA